MNGRHELKYYINNTEYAQLRTRLRAVAKLDKNTGETGCYTVRSLYFDNYADKIVIEKLAGLSRREKFRLRYYNKDTSYIRLEKKSKINSLCYKENTKLTAEHCAALLTKDYDCLKTIKTSLALEFYIKIRCQNLRPKNIVDYNREAYTYPAGNVRITLDSNIRTSNCVAGFLDPQLTTIPVTNQLILEIKYDGFLPGIIQDVLQIGWRSQTEFSKYVIARHV
ncbi:MAG: polyphosphate polymerase domain-containing protein [Nitrososphaerota archaeon]|jgi:SPX domain protein involved in polyphosphate accumulation|nr:polyphosphate polymerase domain-containing protein [Nitrososphaerota archaeon]